VSPAEWGPSSWKLLHGLAERVGNQDNRVMIRDEQNELRIVLKELWALLPCRHCQDHYREWIRYNPPDAFISQGGFYLQDEMRTWVYRLHESVNARREVVSGFDPEVLSETYSTIDLRESANVLKSVYQRGLQTGVLKPDTWKLAWRHLDLLLRLLS